jgi:hypothetical protein
MKVNRDRWVEEVILLEEEVARTERYFRYYSERLTRQSRLVQAGMAAYLARMAATYLKLAGEVQAYYREI